MNQSYKEFSDEKTERNVKNIEFLPMGSLNQSIYQVYPYEIQKAKFGNENKKYKEKNFFNFTGNTIPEYLKQYEEKIFAKSIQSDFLNDKKGQEIIYNNLKAFLSDDFKKSNTEIKINDENLVPKTEIIKFETQINALVLNEDDSKVFCHKKTKLILYDLVKKQEIPLFKDSEKNESDILSIVVNEDFTKVYTLCEERIMIFNSKTGDCINESISSEDFDYYFREMILDDENSTLYVGGNNGKIIRYNSETGEKNDFELDGHEDSITCFVIFDMLISGSEDNTIRIWDTINEKEKYVLKKHFGKITAIAIISNENLLVSGSEDGRIIVWDVRNGNNLFTIDIEEDSGITAMSLLPGDSKIILCLDDNIQVKGSLYWKVRKTLNLF